MGGGIPRLRCTLQPSLPQMITKPNGTNQNADKSSVGFKRRVSTHLLGFYTKTSPLHITPPSAGGSALEFPTPPTPALPPSAHSPAKEHVHFVLPVLVYARPCPPPNQPPRLDPRDGGSFCTPAQRRPGSPHFPKSMQMFMQPDGDVTPTEIP